MQKKDITLTFEDEKLDAMEFSLKKKGSSVQRRMQEALKNLYEQEVAAPVREYLDSKTAPAAKPRRPVKPSRPQAAGASSAIAPPAEVAGKVGD